MADEPLVPPRLLSIGSFRRDLTSFLSQPEQVLRVISTLATGEEGFAPGQALALGEQTDITPDDGAKLLRVAEYLYNRVSEEHIGLNAAVEQLAEAGKTLDVPLGEEQRRGVEEILSYKREYEFGRLARQRATSKGPHFVGIDGSWRIHNYRTRENETVSVPVLGLSISWHDGSGTHEAFTQMTVTEWDEFNARVERLSEERRHLEAFLGE